MKRMFRIEISRALRGKAFHLAIITGIVLSLLHIVIYVIPTAINPLEFFRGSTSYPESVFNNWMGGVANPFYNAYLTLFPILSTIPYAVSYCYDKKTGYTANILLRTKKTNYLIAKYLTTFLFAGITVVVPMMINLVITAAILPSLKPITNLTFYGASGMFGDIYYTHPYLYIILFLCLYFVFGGVFASLSLAGYYLIDNIFLVTLFPFVVYYALGLLSTYTMRLNCLRSITPSKILDMTSSYTTEVTVVILLLSLWIFGIVIFLWRGLKDDCI